MSLRDQALAQPTGGSRLSPGTKKKKKEKEKYQTQEEPSENIKHPPKYHPNPSFSLSRPIMQRSKDFKMARMRGC